MSRELMIFSGNANLALAHEICAYLGAKLGEATVSSFSDGEIRIKIEENVRGADVYVCSRRAAPSTIPLWNC
jgi:ribose-phosphate pyrophosphokinase